LSTLKFLLILSLNLEEHRFYEPKVKFFFPFTLSPFSSISQTKEQDFLPTPFLRSQNPKKKKRGRKLHKEGIFPCFGMRETAWVSDYEIFPRNTHNMFFPKERRLMEILN